MIDWNKLREWFAGSSDAKTVSIRKYNQLLKQRDELAKANAEKDKLIQKAKRKIDELNDQLKLRDSRIQTLTENVEMARSQIAAWTAIFERKRTDAIAGVDKKE